MKKCILSCLLVLALLLTLLPPALAAEPDGSVNAEQTDQPTLVVQWMQKTGDTWEKFEEERAWLNLPDFGGSSDLAQRIWIKVGDTKNPVTSITSENGCYEIQTIEHSDGPLFLFTASRLGKDTLCLTAGTHSITYSVSTQPYSAFYSSDTVSEATFCGVSRYDLTLTGVEQSVWFLSREPVTELVSLKLNDQELTKAADGFYYYYEVNGQRLLRAEWAERADNNGYGLKLTLPAGGAGLSSDHQIRIELHAKTDIGAESEYYGTLVLRPDYRIYISSVSKQGTMRPYKPVPMNYKYPALAFDVLDQRYSSVYAFYYYDPTAKTYTELPFSALKLTNRDGSEVTGGISLTELTESQQWTSPAENMAELRCWALGEYTLSCTLDGKTYSQPLSVTLPYVGLFTDSSYDFAHYIVGRNYERESSTQGKPLTLWLLCRNGLPSKPFTVSMDDMPLTLDDDGYAALGSTEKAVQFRLQPLDEEGSQLGLRIDFHSGKALDALLETNDSISFRVDLGESVQATFRVTADRSTPSGPTAEHGKYVGRTDKPADGTVTPGGVLYVKYNDQIYFLALARSSDSGALDPLRGERFGSRFNEEAVKNHWANGYDLHLAAFAVQENGNFTEAPGMLPKLVSGADFRLTDDSYTAENGGFLSWNDPVSPKDNDPYYHLYLCFEPKNGDGRISTDLTLQDGVTRVQQTSEGVWDEVTGASGTFTLGLRARVQQTTVIDCAKKQLDTMEKLNTFLAGYDFPSGEESRIEIRLAPVAYEGVLRFSGNRPTEQNPETAAVYIMGTVDDVNHTITTIYGGIEISGRVSLLSDLYVKAANGTTVGLRSTQPDALSNVSDVTFDSFDVGLDCDGSGYTVARSCVFKNCKTGIRIDSSAMSGGNANTEWPHNTFYNCDVGVDLISLPPYISPYQLRFYENNFLSNGTDIQVPQSFSGTYYFYRNFFGTLTGELTGLALERAAYQASKVTAPDETVIISPRRKWPIWVDSTTLSIKEYKPAPLTPETNEPAVQALLAAPMRRAAVFAAASPVDKTQLTIEGKTVILNDLAAENIITDPDAFKTDPVSVEVVQPYQSGSAIVANSLGVWNFAAAPNADNGGFNAGLGQYTASEGRISFTVTEQPVLAALAPTLSIPASGWQAAYLTGPDGQRQYIPADNGFTFPVVTGGRYTLTKADPVWAYAPAIREGVFSVTLDTANFADLNGAAIILAVYASDGRMLACHAAERTDGGACSFKLSDAVLSKAASFKLFTLGDGSKPLYDAQRWSKSELSN